jgi:thymidylate synthase (FAD)
MATRVYQKVALLEHTPEPQWVVYKAARMCYAEDPLSIETEMVGREAHRSVEKRDKLLHMLLQRKHLSPLEHASFTFRVTGISRACSHQLVRHRIASYSQRSQRYVSEDDLQYVMPPELDGTSAGVAYIAAMEAAEKQYRMLSESIDKEDARFVLPNACATALVFTMNTRALLNFFAERLCTKAQWEIRTMARSMLQLVQEPFAPLFDTAAPRCYLYGTCPDGDRGCGHHLHLDTGA